MNADQLMTRRGLLFSIGVVMDHMVHGRDGAALLALSEVKTRLEDALKRLDDGIPLPSPFEPISAARAIKISRSVKHSNSPAAALMNQPAARPPATERSPALVTVSQGMVVPEVIPAGSRTSSHATSNSDCSPETGHPLNVKTSKESGNGTDDQVRESQSLRS